MIYVLAYKIIFKDNEKFYIILLRITEYKNGSKINYYFLR